MKCKTVKLKDKLVQVKMFWLKSWTM